MDVSAKVTGIKYNPLLCRELPLYEFKNLETALSSSASFVLRVDDNTKIAVSWWVSPKRTRSYPYARVYDTLGFQGKRVTIIPILKDEGKEGDRDFLQWDTVSLMSLLNVYTIIAFYSSAEGSTTYDQKITNQKFEISQIKDEINKLLSFQSDPLHWNLSQISNIELIGQKALESYDIISRDYNVEMHSREAAKIRIRDILHDKNAFMNRSRKLAEEAQRREVITVQPKENLESGSKAALTIKNYLGGLYYFTADEIHISGDKMFLVEGKHSSDEMLPSINDVKDGLIKMVLFSNLTGLEFESSQYLPIAVLKLTSNNFSIEKLKEAQIEMLKLLKKESETNNFCVIINDFNLKDLQI